MYMHRRQCGAALGSRSVLLTLPAEVRSPPGGPAGGRLPPGLAELGPSPPFDLVAGGDRFEHALQPISCRRSSPRPQPPSLLTGVPARQDAGPSERLGRRARKRARRPLSGLVPAFLCLRPAEGWPLDLGPARGLPGGYFGLPKGGPCSSPFGVETGAWKEGRSKQAETRVNTGCVFPEIGKSFSRLRELTKCINRE